MGLINDFMEEALVVFYPFITSEDDVKQILKTAGFSGFKQSEYEIYMRTLGKEYFARKKGQTIYHKRDTNSLPECPSFSTVCPVCGGTRERKPATHGLGFRDGSFGQLYTWVCENDSTPYQHFITFGIYLLLRRMGKEVTVEYLFANKERQDEILRQSNISVPG